MSTTRSTRKVKPEAQLPGYNYDEHGMITGFDVVAVVGTVDFTTGHGEHPFMAACRLIHESGGTGTFTFPHEGGGMVTLALPVPERPCHDCGASGAGDDGLCEPCRTGRGFEG